MIKLKFVNEKVSTFKDGAVTVYECDCKVLRTETHETLTQFKAKGKARKNPADASDPNLAVKLAKARAKEKAYKRAMEFMEEEFDLEFFNDALFFTDQMFWCRDREGIYLQNLEEPESK